MLHVVGRHPTCLRRIILGIVLGFISFGLSAVELDQRVYHNAIAQECHGCHFENRMKPVGTLANGASQWTDQKCVACHTEIDEVASHYRQGIDDFRYVALPVKDERLKSMADYPLAYLDAPVWPVFQSKSARVNRTTLVNFLNAPHGTCHEGTCIAPGMMAYTGISESDVLAISEHFSAIPAETQREQQGSIRRGKMLFDQKCATCHDSSQPSGYNATAMSLFSAHWIEQYANGPVVAGRSMPRMTVSRRDAHDLYAYFQDVRARSQTKLAQAVSQIELNFERLPQKHLSAKALTYIWHGFWRDTGCVHCHGIEGRAKDAFSMASRREIEHWLKTKDARALYQRLAIREKEEAFGLGAAQAGMPATGRPLPSQLIQLLGIWIKSGCPNETHQQLCQGKWNDQAS
ncbi:c-type cytochrome [Photobacterium sp. 1_MG-2023]|uniref:c-type cytochrome n=1 Tax=Photobacterium sp. 1_MG-2023 TaxID=3062646 RepID=UPI0026E1D223|nr:c-type cytochrome [Photobacterium sp. 1_MG-2023]MDO6705303.1 c-type cytochrome [Photobacterium sp. 1_MG-2023]